MLPGPGGQSIHPCGSGRRRYAKRMTNDEIATCLRQIGRLLELKDENPFKSRAYHNGARAIESNSTPVARLVEAGKLDELEGIGAALREKITTLVATGHLTYFEQLKAEFPDGIFDLLDLEGLGPKKAKVLFRELGIGSLEDLEARCRAGQVEKLDGFGRKTAEKLLEAIERRKSFSGMFRYAEVIGRAEDLLDELRQHPDVIRVALAGSLRRGKEVVKDVDLLASSKAPLAVMEAFAGLVPGKNVIATGETKSSIWLEDGLQVDLRVVPDAAFASALHHFTGSKEHNVALRKRAKERGLKISEWGIFSQEDEDQKNPLTCPNEASFFQHLDLQEIPPELRENQGEIEAAESDSLPKLVEWTQLRGCFHNHTNASDGKNSLEEMAEAAASIGLDYLGIADHSKSSVQANGLSEERLMEQVESIQEMNDHKDSDIYLFSGVECDILKDGSLDFGDGVLGKLDYVVASVHSSFSLPEHEQTRRICRAMENPYVTMLGHLTGRLLLRRAGYEVDIDRILRVAAETGTWMELNANPYRLELDWRHWRKAREMGVKCVINPDAHATGQLGYLKPAVQVARKGWLREQDVVNCWSLPRMKKVLAEN